MNLRRFIHIIRHPRKAISEYNAKEKHILRKHGIDPEHIYYIIRCKLPECGFFAIFMYVLDHLAICEDNGYIPVMDLAQYQTLYKEDHPVNGSSDPWLYFYEPLSDAKPEINYANKILSPIKFPHYKAIYYYKNKEENVLPSKERINYLYKIVSKYIRFNMTVNGELEEAGKILTGRKVLGIHVRGTDMYTEGKQHPIPTGKTKDFSVIDEIIREHGIDQIFLCTDTEETVELFREHYGAMLITTDAVRQKDNANTGIHKDPGLSHRQDHKYRMGLEVIRDMYLLSKCSVLLCGPSNVAFVAMVYNNFRYERVYYFV